MAVPAVIDTGFEVGNDAGWALAFYSDTTAPPGGRSQTRAIRPQPKLLLSRDDYYAEIEAVLPGDFSPGRYTFVVEGLIDEHYAQIAVDDVVRLYLFWRDTSSAPGGPPNLAGMVDRLTDLTVEQLQEFLVAELVVTGVSRRAGARRYETTIEARERVFMRLRGPGLPDSLGTATFADAARKLVDGLDISVDLYGFTPSGLVANTPSAHPGDEKMPLDPEKTRARAIADLGKALEQAHKDKRGRGMLLIRRGKLLVGPRDIPLGPVIEPVVSQRPDRERPRQAADGAVARRPGGAAGARQAPVPAHAQGPPRHPPRRRRPLPARARGRQADDARRPAHGPHERPRAAGGRRVDGEAGDAVRERGRASAGPEERLRDVDRGRRDQGRHRVLGCLGPRPAAELGLEAGRDRPQGVDPERRGGRGPRGQLARGQGGGGEAVLRHRRGPRRRTGSRRASRNRRHRRRPCGAGSTAPTGARTRRAACRSGASSRRRSRASRTRARSPGGSAVSSCRAIPGPASCSSTGTARHVQPVDVGAVWESAQGPDTLAGDWWLILPAGIDDDKREKASGDAQPKPWFEEVTNDLIDADGNRIIHVGELTIRVGKLTLAGDRPDRAPLKQGVTIEHAAGDARITIDKDGKIRVEAKGDLELVSKQGDIELQASQGSVNVSVANSMEVS